ncbi:CAP Gly-rich domain-containing protein [Jimgerdemannia flammicorona]|uniref:CAP Gly-rich domain-containing protein n=1 Tax=Jimgerdemannia flammicorona TaxID=994334 RepID=A0A433D5N3_9FUNG|nr:CAP Gly-rich domain-containing protein [Jimgerdemannia flammicorona]
MSIVTVFVSTSAEKVGAERRFDKGLSIAQLKYKLEPITGIPADTQQLSLYNGENLIGSLEGDENMMLGAFPVENFVRIHHWAVIAFSPHFSGWEQHRLSSISFIPSERALPIPIWILSVPPNTTTHAIGALPWIRGYVATLHEHSNQPCQPSCFKYPFSLQVVDTNPNRVRNQYTDVSLVDKYEMPEEDYAKRSDSVLAFKLRNKLGRFADGASEVSEASFEEEAKDIKVGDRCEVNIGDGELRRRGTVRFVGLTKFKPGYWVGVQYDEPLGKNDGTVDGEQYFTAPNKYGAFVRPNKVRVGDFPEENLDDELEEM